MAVYTKINKSELEELLKNYNIGNLIKYEEIKEGVENSNFKIFTSENIFILTIFEKRVAKNEIPFFIKLMNYLNMNNFQCPRSIPNINGEFISRLKEKPCTIVTFIKGNWIKNIKNIHCQQLGINLSKLHSLTKNFTLSRKNNIGFNSWKNLFNNFKSKQTNIYTDAYKIIEEEIEFLIMKWPKKLPSGIIHADLFQDNVFFENDQFTGMIDFYFACNDFYAYELAVCLNAWCFEKDQSFNITKASLILNEYQKKRPLEEDEKKYFTILSRGAAIRFLLTRFNDLIFHSPKNLVQPKDPNEYLKILYFHQKIKSINEYGFIN